VTSFVNFVREFFVEASPLPRGLPAVAIEEEPSTQTRLHVESLAVYPIKSCGAFSVPPGMAWEVRREGLIWDREWCLVHQGTGAALSQKRYPKMALIRPSIDMEEGLLRVQLTGILRDTTWTNVITVPLSADPRLFEDADMYKEANAKVCGDRILAKTYKSEQISEFFSQALGVACHLARFPTGGIENGTSIPSR